MAEEEEEEEEDDSIYIHVYYAKSPCCLIINGKFLFVKLG
jgi:hypothetical protein